MSVNQSFSLTLLQKTCLSAFLSVWTISVLPFYVFKLLLILSCSFPPWRQHRPLLSLPPTASVFPPACVCACVCVLFSVETPISRMSSPPEGHSQCFGVRTEKGWAGQEAELSAGLRGSHTIAILYLL